MSRLATEVQPFLLARPRALSPVVLTCEHASGRLPFPRQVPRSQRALLDTHWAWDIGAWALTRDLSRRLQASAIGGRWSRLLIDLNRRVDDPMLVRRTVERIPLAWNQAIEPTEIERRVLAYHTPYHAEIDRLILRRLVRGVRPILFAVHTFTPRMHGRPRPFEIGILYEHHPAMAHRLGRDMRDAGLTVRYNQPYSGRAGMMYAVDRHGSHHRLPCLEVEVNQAMFDDRGAVARLGETIEAGLRGLLERSGA